MQTRITWHGHSNFQIAQGEVNVIIDPFFEGNPHADARWDAIARPDIVLVTHDHGDHVGQAVEICKATGAMLGCVVGTAEKLVEAGLPAKQVLNTIGFNIGGTIEYKGVRVTMTQAYHSSESGVPVGFIITMPDGFTIYHAGDTGIFSEMDIWGRLYAIDIALLPIGGVFTMDPRQAAHACSMLRARSVVPMHWGTFPVLEQNTTSFREHLERNAPDCRLFVMSSGESLTLDRSTEGCLC